MDKKEIINYVDHNMLLKIENLMMVVIVIIQNILELNLHIQ